MVEFRTGIEDVSTCDVLVIGGGVSANSYLRKEAQRRFMDKLDVLIPPLWCTTDNAAMIASAGYYNYIAGKRDNLSLNAVPNLKL